MDTALREYPQLVKKYFGTVIPPNDNKFSALNTAVWSGGSFIYVPPGVAVEMPLQAYFRINAENMRSEEHTSELQSLMRISYAVFCLTKNIHNYIHPTTELHHLL